MKNSMKNDILFAIKDKSDYMAVLEAVSGAKTSFTEEEKASLLAIYIEIAAKQLGFAGETLVKAILDLDVPGANLLDRADADALTALRELYMSWEPDAEKAREVKTAALSGDVSEPLALALARAALDILAGLSDIAPYREDINALAEFLGKAEKETFADASVFLIRVRERVR